jgi:hypothetical protein
MSEKEGSEAMAMDEISRLRERNSQLLDLLADAVDMLNIAMMEIHAWQASGSPTEEERKRGIACWRESPRATGGEKVATTFRYMTLSACCT